MTPPRSPRYPRPWSPPSAPRGGTLLKLSEVPMRSSSPRRALVALLLLAACSPGSSPSSSPSEPSATSLTASSQAVSLLTSLRGRFRLAPRAELSSADLPDGAGELAGGSLTTGAGESEPLLARSEVERYEVRDGWVIPHLPDSAFQRVSNLQKRPSSGTAYVGKCGTSPDPPIPSNSPLCGHILSTTASTTSATRTSSPPATSAVAG